jgi:hypothetical protein
VFSESFAYLGCLKGEFTGGDEEESLDLVDFDVYLFESGDDEGGCLSSTL